MYVQRRPFLALWLLRWLLAEQVFAGTMTFQEGSTSGISGPPYSDSSNAEWSVSDADTGPFASNFGKVLDASESVVAESKSTPSERPAGKLLSTRAKEYFRSPFLFRGLRVSLRLLLVVCLGVAGWKRLAARKPALLPGEAERVTGAQEEKKGQVKGEMVSAQQPEGSQEVMDTSLVRARARLEKIRTLLPAANRLACAVDSDESTKLLKAIYGVLEDADDVTRAVTERKKVEDSVAEVLEALRGLHQAACKRADEHVEAAKSLPQFLGPETLDAETLKCLASIDRSTETQAAAVLLKACFSFEECLKRVTKQMDQGRMLVDSSQQFAHEDDGALLLSTAISLEFLRERSDYRSSLITAAKDVSNDLLGHVKHVLQGACRETAYTTADNLAALNVYRTMQKSNETGEDAGATTSLPEKGSKAQHDDFEREFTQFSFLFTQLQSVRRTIRESTTVKTLCTAEAETANIRQKALDVIKGCWKTAGSLPISDEPLTSGAQLLAAERANAAFQTLVVANGSMSSALKEVRDLLAHANEDAHTFSSHNKLVKKQGSIVDALTLQMASRISEAKMGADLIKGETNAWFAIKELFRMGTHIRSQEKDRKKRELLKVSSRFIVLLKKDIKKTACEVARIASRIHSSDWMQYEKLLAPFSAARTAFDEAVTLQDAAQAAADTRFYAIAIGDLLLALSKKVNQSKL